MTEAIDPTTTPPPAQDALAAPPPPPPAPGGMAVPAYGAPAVAPSAGQLGKIRSTGTCFLLAIVTLGIYTWFWYYNVHDEMKRHSGTGLGGAVALILGIFVGPVMIFLTPHEVGGLYKRQGQPEPVSAITGLWVLIPIIGSIIWFVKTNGALNSYWRSLGAQG
jgi:hypothetical protein